MDKQIEEMAKTLCANCRKDGYSCSLYSSDDDWVCAQERERAEFFYNAGYRKIPENAVVLSGTETEEHLIDLLVDFDEMSFFPATLTPNPEEYVREWKRKLIYAIGQLRKETAEKFADRLVDFFVEKDIGNRLCASFTIAEWHKMIDEILKEITEGTV